MKWTTTALVGACMISTACSAHAGVDVGPQVAIAEADGADRVWVCHRGRWQAVGAPAADAHAGHGDRVSTTRRPERSSC